jgi:hypothetical protein
MISLPQSRSDVKLSLRRERLRSINAAFYERFGSISGQFITKMEDWGCEGSC